MDPVDCHIRHTDNRRIPSSSLLLTRPSKEAVSEVQLEVFSVLAVLRRNTTAVDGAAAAAGNSHTGRNRAPVDEEDEREPKQQPPRPLVAVEHPPTEHGLQNSAEPADSRVDERVSLQPKIKNPI